MKKTCVIISGGEYASLTDIYSKHDKPFVIACDKGYTYARKDGIMPDLLISDFDSYAGEIDRSIKIERHEVEKDDTDTMLAIRYAIEHGYRDLDIRCAFGGRLDHLYANIQSGTYAMEHGCESVTMQDADTAMYYINSGLITLPSKKETSLSVFAAYGECTGVCITGCKYPLDEATIDASYPIGVSNEWVEKEATISVKKGILIIMECKKIR